MHSGLFLFLMLAWQEGRICLYRAVILRRFGHVCLLGYTRRLGCIVIIIIIISLRSLWENSKNSELGLFGLVLEGVVCVCAFTSFRSWSCCG